MSFATFLLHVMLLETYEACPFLIILMMVLNMILFYYTKHVHEHSHT